MKELFKKEGVKGFEVWTLKIRGGLEIIPEEKTILRFSKDWRKFYLYVNGKIRIIWITDTILKYTKIGSFIFK